MNTVPIIERVRRSGSLLWTSSIFGLDAGGLAKTILPQKVSPQRSISTCALREGASHTPVMSPAVALAAPAATMTMARPRPVIDPLLHIHILILANPRLLP